MSDLKPPTNKWDFLTAMVWGVCLVTAMFATATNWADLSEVKTTAYGGGAAFIVHAILRKVLA